MFIPDCWETLKFIAPTGSIKRGNLGKYRSEPHRTAPVIMTFWSPHHQKMPLCGMPIHPAMEHPGMLAMKKVPVGGCPTPLKNMKSVGMMTFPAECKVKKLHGSKPPTSWGLYQIHLFRLHLPPFSPRLRRVHRQRWGTSCPHFAKKGHGGSLRPSPLRYPPHPQSVDCPKSVFVALSWRWLVTSTVANPWPLVDHVGGSRSA
jgi:hypothetical protein